MIPTYKDNPKFWEEMGKKKIVQLIYTLSKSDKCPMCKYEEKGGWMEQHKNEVISLYKIIPKFLIHMKTTHGFPPEVFIDMYL